MYTVYRILPSTPEIADILLNSDVAPINTNKSLGKIDGALGDFCVYSMMYAQYPDIISSFGIYRYDKVGEVKMWRLVYTYHHRPSQLGCFANVKTLHPLPQKIDFQALSTFALTVLEGIEEK
jgi:hypothetical protein